MKLSALETNCTYHFMLERRNKFYKFCFSPIVTISEYRQMEYFDGTTVPACFTNADTVGSVSYFLVINTMFYLGPFLLLIFMYSVIARHLMADPGTNCSERAYNVRARKQVVAMLITVVVSFFLCLLPFRLFTMWIILAPSQLVVDTKNGNYYNILFSCRVLLYLNSAVNPILYNLMSSKFRHGFKNLLPLCGHRSQLQMRMSTSRTATLTHSSTKITILGRTGSSLLRRGQIAMQENGRISHQTQSAVALNDNRVSKTPGTELQLMSHYQLAKDTILESTDQPESFV